MKYGVELLWRSFKTVPAASTSVAELQDGATVDASDALRHGMFESASPANQYFCTHPAYSLYSIEFGPTIVHRKCFLARRVGCTHFGATVLYGDWYSL